MMWVLEWNTSPLREPLTAISLQALDCELEWSEEQNCSTKYYWTGS